MTRSPNKPVVFVAGEKRYAIRPVELGVEPDWKGAVAAAQRQGDGFGPIRGFRRLDVQGLRGRRHAAHERPERRTAVPARADRQGGEPRAARRRRRPARPEGRRRSGAAGPHPRPRRRRARDRARSLPRSTAPRRRSSCRSASSSRRIRAAALARAARQARLALSAPVHLELRKTRWVLTPRRLARLLELPSEGRTQLTLGGAAADQWLVKLGARVAKPPKDADVRRRRLARLRRAGAAGHPARRDRHSRRRARRGVEAPAGAARRAPAGGRGAGEAHDGGGARDADPAHRRHLHDRLRRHPEPHPQRGARRASRRRHADRAGRDVFVQPDDRRAQRGEGASSRRR